MGKEYSRKQFLRMFPFGYVDVLIDGQKAGESDEAVLIFRPPGAAGDEKKFLKLCDRCRKCGEACPHGVIFFGEISDGKIEGTPLLDPGTRPCRWCSGMPCIEACPTGALKMTGSDNIEQIGYAVIDMELCSTSMGILCDTCITACPSSIKAVRLNAQRRPEISIEKCTGCGLCSYYCDAEPGAITVKNNSRHS